MIRGILREWLGVNDIERAEIMKAMIRVELKAMIDEVFDKDEKLLDTSSWSDYENFKTLKGFIVDIVEREARSTAYETSQNLITSGIDEKVNKEEFLDGIIKRILNKQI